MTDPQTADAIRRTERAQSAASDPAASAWVAANAGAGKTHVLKMRVLRLLLEGTAPERILCLTYTKAAAAEMAERVFTELAHWATTDDNTLRALLRPLTARAVDDRQLAAARTLFARAIETPGGLKVQTIHAFCERLLQRFPLEAGVTPGFAILDDRMAATLFEEAIAEMLGAATADRGSIIGQALTDSVAHVQGEQFEALVRTALGHRSWLAAVRRLGDNDADVSARLREIYSLALGVDPDRTAGAVVAEGARLLDDTGLARAVDILRSGGKIDQDDAAKLAHIRMLSSDGERFSALAAALLTRKGEPRSDKRFVSAAIRKREAGMAERLCGARDRIARLVVERRSIETVAATVALALIGDAVMQGYTAAKRRRASLDFDDLIERTASLLSVSAAADWVLYKLDGGIDHLLVDEAQDTSPRQWAIVEAMVQEFYAGAGARSGPGDKPPGPRTVFAVGDRKQSIYSFQGAAPEEFAAVGARLRALAGAAGVAWREVPLTLSFRTVPPILEAVDRVFADPGRTPGLDVGDGRLLHQARRIGDAGLVEIWPTETPDPVQDEPAFEPGLAQRSASPAERLAGRIADRIATWLQSSERLASEDRPIRPGDILVLVARRRPFADVMVSALKARGIPVAGADRMRLTDQIAVKDLIALGNVLALPEDDLALAAVLKSPLFGLSDEDLLAIAPGRPGSLYAALMRAARDGSRFGHAAATLKRWRAVADRRPPYEFYARLLDEDGVRGRLLGRLGPEAVDAIDEFLAMALAYDEANPASLQGFLEQLRQDDHEIKRDMEPGRDQVRVLTVHGSKGLEAPIVFLPDTCSADAAVGRESLLALPPDPARGAGLADGVAMRVWALPGSPAVPAVMAARESFAEASRAERNRLLYVALTRARDRLYVAGFEGGRGLPADCWYRTVRDGLREHLAELPDGDGRVVLRLESGQTAPVTRRGGAAAARTEIVEPPPWATTPARREIRPTIPLAPSRLMPLDVDEEGEPRAVRPMIGAGAGATERRFSDRTGRSIGKLAESSREAASARMLDAAQHRREPGSPPPGLLAADHRFLRGRITHALLEILPDLPEAERQRSAREFVAVRGEGLSPAARDSIVRETLDVLQHPEFSHVFGPGSRAEVPLVAEIPHPEGARLPVRITGQIDRLLRTDHGVLIIDYKTNRPPPIDVDAAPTAYLVQLAAYRLVLKKIFQTDRVRAALLWTDGARLMPIPDEMLDRHERLVWDHAEGEAAAPSA